MKIHPMSNGGTVNLLVIHDRKEHAGVARHLGEAPVINKAALLAISKNGCL